MTTGLTPTLASDIGVTTGSFPGPGTYFCLECHSQLSIRERDRLPRCPRCGSDNFRLDSIFEPMQEHGAATAEFDAPADPVAPEWLAEMRARLTPGSRHLIFADGDAGIVDCAVSDGWTRIGRSASADLRLDDPSVSRRHALVVCEPGRALRVLDDRSLNGVFVNGRPVEWGKLEDGDELGIGRYRLFALTA